MAKPSPSLCGRSAVVPTGRALGGGSSVNCMKAILFFVINTQTEVFFFEVMGYTRAAASDYDDWENVYGNKGWGSQHLIPLLKKVIRVSRSISMEPTLDFFLNRQKHTNRFQRILPMANRGRSKSRSQNNI